MTSRQIRQQFLDFFRQRGHEIVASSPVVPFDDPTLMFTNAGMNQFKDVFLGTGSRSYVRVANTQKCIRAGGKHNDLDDVGQDTYHHTFFEMLGNWSFGDYFKKEAIQWAWELLTGVWGIEKDRLHATYFEGDAREGLEPDEDSAKLWRSVTDIRPDHIHPGSKKDNFWEMGDKGPCGPCSEIHIDLTPDKSGRSLVNAGDPNVIELWNLVFIQFDSYLLPGGLEALHLWDKTPSSQRSALPYRSREEILAKYRRLRVLPAKHVDTGLGLERLCAVLNGKKSNYDTDVFAPLFAAIRERTKAPGYKGTLPGDEKRDGGRNGRRDEGGVSLEQVMIDVSYRVIADHLRCLVFALTDGAIPSNEGPGYVLRCILRRAMLHGGQYFRMTEPFLCDLVAPVVDNLAGVFPELRTAHGGKNVDYVVDLIREEEAAFLKTRDRGLSLFEQSAAYAIGDAIGKSQNLKFERAQALALAAFDEYAADAIGRSIGKSKVVKFEASGTGWNSNEESVPGVAPARKSWRLWFRDASDRQRCIEVDSADAEAARKHTNITPVISGMEAFTLHDTYGFLIDLTLQFAAERGLDVDIAEYERLMEEARKRARTGSRVTTDELLDSISFDDTDDRSRLPLVDTDDSWKYSHPPECEATILYLAAFNGQSIGDDLLIVTDKTCFYTEQGGQVADTGFVRTETGEIGIEFVKRKKRGIIVHKGRITRGTVAPDQPCHMVVDWSRRRSIMQNHSTTHILNWALREVLGELVEQKGSLVDPEKTRFDFSHKKPLTSEELTRIEELVGRQIEAGYAVYTKEVDQEAARQITTLRAVFGEKYPDRVRVVSIGADIDAMLADPKNPKWMKYSVEFCGGTHLNNSSEAERFVLISEEAVAKGVRRVVGITGSAAREAERAGEKLLAEAKAIGEGPGEEVASKLANLQKAVDEAVIPVRVTMQLRDRIGQLREIAKKHGKEKAGAAAGDVMAAAAKLLDESKVVGQTQVIVGEVPPAAAQALRCAVDWFRQKTPSSAVLLACHDGKKVTLVAGMSRDVVDKGIKAGDLIKEVAPMVGGKGGGRPDLAQGGGSDPSGIPAVLDQARESLYRRLGD